MKITEANVRKVLGSLGATRTEVAKTLEKEKIKGIWCHAKQCPVARYVRKKMKTRCKITMTRLYSNVGKVQIEMPKPVSKFIDAFDAMKYQNLIMPLSKW